MKFKNRRIDETYENPKNEVASTHISKFDVFPIQIDVQRDCFHFTEHCQRPFYPQVHQFWHHFQVREKQYFGFGQVSNSS